jgi:hypothetical protein
MRYDVKKCNYSMITTCYSVDEDDNEKFKAFLCRKFYTPYELPAKEATTIEIKTYGKGKKRDNLFIEARRNGNIEYHNNNKNEPKLIMHQDCYQTKLETTLQKEHLAKLKNLYSNSCDDVMGVYVDELLTLYTPKQIHNVLIREDAKWKACVDKLKESDGKVPTKEFHDYVHKYFNKSVIQTVTFFLLLTNNGLYRQKIPAVPKEKPAAVSTVSTTATTTSDDK